jgi:hypothetical protein
MTRRVTPNQSVITNGIRLNVPSNPPSTDNNPWNTIVVKATSNLVGSPIDVLASDAIIALANQLGVPPAITFEIRVQAIKVWGNVPAFSGAALPTISESIAFSPYSLFNNIAGVQYLLRTFNDEPDGVNRSAVGFRWPTSQQTVIFRTGDLDKLFTLAGPAGSTEQILIHFHLLYRFPANDDPVPRTLKFIKSPTEHGTTTRPAVSSGTNRNITVTDVAAPPRESLCTACL